jgi:hypothetical protein
MRIFGLAWMPLLAIGLLLATGHLHGRRRHAKATHGPPQENGWCSGSCGSPGAGAATWCSAALWLLG